MLYNYIKSFKIIFMTIDNAWKIQELNEWSNSKMRRDVGQKNNNNEFILVG